MRFVAASDARMLLGGSDGDGRHGNAPPSEFRLWALSALHACGRSRASVSKWATRRTFSSSGAPMVSGKFARPRNAALSARHSRYSASSMKTQRHALLNAPDLRTSGRYAPSAVGRAHPSLCRRRTGPARNSCRRCRAENGLAAHSVGCWQLSWASPASLRVTASARRRRGSARPAKSVEQRFATS